MKTKTPNTKVPYRKDSSPKWYRILAEFASSPADSIELIPDPGEYKQLKTAQSVACTAIRRYGFRMSTVRDGDHLYLVKDKQ